MSLGIVMSNLPMPSPEFCSPKCTICCNENSVVGAFFIMSKMVTPRNWRIIDTCSSFLQENYR